MSLRLRRWNRLRWMFRELPFNLERPLLESNKSEASWHVKLFYRPALLSRGPMSQLIGNTVYSRANLSLLAHDTCCMNRPLGISCSALVPTLMDRSYFYHLFWLYYYVRLTIVVPLFSYVVDCNGCGNMRSCTDWACLLKLSSKIEIL